MRQIWKYDLDISDDVQRVQMPAAAEIVYADMQGGILCFWAVVNPSLEKTPRLFIVHGTGQPVAENEKYIATVNARPFVWHIFEK